MKRTCGAMILSLLMAAFSSQAFAEFAAIAYSRATGAYGFSYGYATYDEAVSRAMSECYARASSCELGGWVQDGCVALAKDPQGYWGVGFENGFDNRAYYGAQTNAVEQCRVYSFTDNCNVQVTTCSFH